MQHPPEHLAASRPNRLRHLLAAAALAAIALTLPAQAEIVTIAFDGEQRYSHRFEVAPGKFAEACGQLARGSAVQWRFNASLPLNFNIHYHEGKAVTYPEKQNGSTGAEGTLRVAVDEAYCWMWTNKTAQPAIVTIELVR